MWCGRTVDWCLTTQLLEHLGSSCQPISRLADGDVEDQLLDLQLAHGVGALSAGRAILGGSIAFCLRLVIAVSKWSLARDVRAVVYRSDRAYAVVGRLTIVLVMITSWLWLV